MDILFIAFANSGEAPLPALQEEGDTLYKTLSPRALKQHSRTLIFCSLLTFSTLLLSGCGSAPRGAYAPGAAPPAPDYSQDKYWAALPWKDDEADLTPNGLADRQAEAEVDVFFLHPTTYTGKKGDDNWNGPVQDPEVNKRTLERPIKYQASIFNGVGRVFAPFYRQAHLRAYFTRDTISAGKAFELAYSDVRAAFQYYLNHYNQGRPIVIATHSQGTTHGIRLLQEFFDGKPLQEKLVAAYLIGIQVEKDDFQNITPCRDSLDTGCFVAWRTFKRGYEPKKNSPREVVINPLLWTAEKTYAPRSLNLGAVLVPFEEVRPNNTDAQVNGSVLWASKPKFPGSFLMLRKNYHAGDMNLYYVNIRKNAQDRAKAFGGG